MKKLTTQERDTVNACTEDLIDVYSQVCDRLGTESRIAKRLDRVLSILEMLRTDC